VEDTVVNTQPARGRRHVFNLDMDRLMHRHGDNWIEMAPLADHTPDPRDPERRLLRGERVYRCQGCDEEISVMPPEVPR
jgi:hypothetical protein